jgi:hypothetical protein
MKIETRKLVAAAALIVATSITAAQAGTVFPTDSASYARWRVDAAFDVVAKMPVVAPVRIPMAMKGDLPIPLGCAGASADARDECMDVAYETESEPSIVVETRVGSTSTLMRMDAMTMAGITAQPFQQSE